MEIIVDSLLRVITIVDMRKKIWKINSCMVIILDPLLSRSLKISESM